MTIDLAIVWAFIIGFGIIMYVIMDGFDLGLGILYPFAPDDQTRDVMMNSVAPVWDGNETWLVLGGAGLLGAFPLVYSVFLPALYIGVFLMLAGLIFRGVSFEFRFKSTRNRHWWNRAFFCGSVVATFAQGAVAGAYVQGFAVHELVYVGGALDWLTPFTVLTGLGLIAGYSLLGATWLIMKSEGYIQQWAFSITLKLLLAVLATFIIVSIWTPVVSLEVRSRWLDQLHVIWLLPALALCCAVQVYRSVKRQHEVLPFVMSLGVFVFTYLGLVASKWPVIVPPDYTIWDASSSPESQLFLLIGMIFVVPAVLMYTAWSYWVFRGKVKVGDSYH